MNTIVDVLSLRASVTPDRLAYSVAGDSVTYGQLAETVRTLAWGLQAGGVGRGARCAVLLPTSLHFIRAIYAAQLLGAAPVALDPSLPADALARRIRMVRPVLLITSREALRSLHAGTGNLPCASIAVEELEDRGRVTAAPAAHPDDVAFLQYTSGTTGEPRAAVVLHRQLLASLEASQERYNLSPDVILAGWIPLHHGFGLVRFVFGALFYGCPSYLIPASLGNLRPWLETIDRVRATVTGGPDLAYSLAARTIDPSGLNLASLRLATNGGEAVRASTIRQFEARFQVPGAVQAGYGLSEATLAVAAAAPGSPLRCDPAGHVSCGPPLKGFSVRIATPDGREAPPGTDGEILVQGPSVFGGYFDDPVQSAEAVRDGWLHTGDVGCIDAEGELFVKGRRRALIKRAGRTIAPREIEEVVDLMAGVRRSAAVGVVDESGSGTEELIVVAELEAELAGTDGAPELGVRIGDEVRRAIGILPGRVLLVLPDTIPRATNGKLRYADLRIAIARGALAARTIAVV